jgi:acyl-coenzyme A thioesterase PaaI-like protein
MPGARLAGELRRLSHELHAVDADPVLLDELAEAVAALRRRLTGPPRLRWYEHPTEGGKPGADGRGAFTAYSLYRGERNALAPPMSVALAEVDGRPSVVGRVVCDRRYEGPPGGVHGGYVAGLFDDVLGGTQQLLDGPTGLTGILTVRYRNVTPLDVPLRFVAWVESERGRRIVSKATCHAGEVLTAQAEALFVRVDLRDVADRMTGGGAGGVAP